VKGESHHGNAKQIYSLHYDDLVLPKRVVKVYNWVTKKMSGLKDLLTLNQYQKKRIINQVNTLFMQMVEFLEGNSRSQS
jgi:hypothetical protein